MKQKISYLLVFFAIIGFFFRFAFLPQNLFFGYEQGRDFLVIQQLVYQHHLTLIGPKTDISGVFHGPFYYYLAAIPLAVSDGNPLVVIGFLIFLQVISVFLLYAIGKEIGNKRTGLIAAFLFAISFGAIVSARWISNPPLSIPLFCLFYLCLMRFFKGDKKYLFFAVIAEGLLGQVEFINFLYLGIFSIITVICFRKKFRILSLPQNIGAFVLLLCVSFGTYLLFDVRHSFLMTKSVLGLLSGNTGYHLSYVDAIAQTFTQFFTVFSDTIFPISLSISIGISLVGLITFVLFQWKYGIRGKLLLLWLVLPLILLSVLRYAGLYQLFLALIPAMIIVVSLCIDKLEQKFHYVGVFCLFIVVICNLGAWLNYIPHNQRIFFQSTQPDLRYSDEQAAIQWIYNQANGMPFSYRAYTIPFWSPQGWDYLFWYDGTHIYHYIPTENSMEKKLFVIVQRDPNNIKYQQDWLTDLRKNAQQVSSKQFGILRVNELIEK